MARRSRINSDAKSPNRQWMDVSVATANRGLGSPAPRNRVKNRFNSPSDTAWNTTTGTGGSG